MVLLVHLSEGEPRFVLELILGALAARGLKLSFADH